MKSEYRKHNVIMVLCILLGGFSIIASLFIFYTSSFGTGSFEGLRSVNNSSELMISRNNITLVGRPIGRGVEPVSSGMFLASPFFIIFMLNGIALIAGGVSIWNLTREKEITSTKEKITSLLLMPEEKRIIEELKKSKGSMTQSQLVKNTGMSKVKAHRIVSKLVSKGIIKKYPYGLTNKIVLEKDV